jgi:sulfite reductase (NADPH) hemoprotein beta-component
MYQYTDFDKQFVQAARRSSSATSSSAGSAATDRRQFRPLRLQNGWYMQRYAPMLRVAVPYGELSQHAAARAGPHRPRLRPPDTRAAGRGPGHAGRMGDAQPGLTAAAAPLKYGYGHFTTRRTCSSTGSRWTKAADVMDLLASVDMHGIQTSGNCIRNITSDALAGIAVDEIVDPRPFAEILRQWSTLHPEFAFLPRKFKIAINGAAKTAPPPAGTTSACSCSSATTPAKWASRCWWAAAWAARRSSAP